MIWHSNSINDVINQLNTNTETGLSSTEARNRYEHISSKIKKIKQRKRNYATFLLKRIAKLSLCAYSCFGGFLYYLPFNIRYIIADRAYIAYCICTDKKQLYPHSFDYSGSTKLQSASFEERAAINVMRDGKVQLKNAGDIVPGDIYICCRGRLCSR